MVIIEIFAAWYLPMEISFSNKEYRLPLIFSEVILGFFVLDILISFNTGREDKGIELYDRNSISKLYFKGNFFFDIIALGSLTYAMTKNEDVEMHLTDIFGFFTILKISHIL